MNSIIIVGVLGIIAMLSDVLRIRKWVPTLMISGLGIAFVLSIVCSSSSVSLFHDTIRMDNFAIGFSSLLLFVAVLWMSYALPYIGSGTRMMEKMALVLFAICGSLLLVSYYNFSVFFIGLEIVSICAYVLAGSNKDDLKSNEASIKYFMMGAFATGFLLFGLALVYGVTGSFNLEEIALSIQGLSGQVPWMLYAGILLIMVGVCFKVSIVPFHFWTPDVYEGSPSHITAFMANIIKIAAFAAFFRMFYNGFAALSSWWSPILAVLSAATIISGNLLAIYQSSFKRMMAYSSISHAGFMLMAIAAFTQYSMPALFIYSAVYALGSIAVFIVISAMSKNGEEHLMSLKGFSEGGLARALAFSIALLSLAGIPPLAGFFGKYYVILSAISDAKLWLAIVAIVGSIIGAFYYLKSAAYAFKPMNPQSKPIELDQSSWFLLILCGILTIIISFSPDFLMSLMG
ncbi:MAG TPA: NADH-quinone oxidoreductase subunit N [Bacteroidia bacterium]|nr:NADH-quinone oxidoreductase subunit N [Bacteroidia bacterium]